MNLNKVILVGRVVRQPEQKMLPSGNAVTSFSLATNRTWKGQDGQKQEETEFHNCTAFGKMAETIGTYVQKGQEILVEGRIKTETWEKDGAKRYSTKIIVETFQFGAKAGGADQGPQDIKKVDPAEIPVIEEPGIMQPEL